MKDFISEDSPSRVVQPSPEHQVWELLRLDDRIPIHACLTIARIIRIFTKGGDQ